MSQAVVIVKIAYYRGGGQKVHGRKQSGWQKHIEYLATKPEVDKGDADALRVGDDGYELDDAALHARYAAVRPGSSGLFGADGDADWRDVAAELDKHPLPAWRMIVSMREADAVGWGMISREAWEPAIREAVEDAAKAMHLDPDHLRWAAAFHAKPGQPHAHIVVWETPHAAARGRGLLEEGERRGVWRAFTRELFRGERDRLAAEKEAIRQTVRELAKGDVERAAEVARAIKTIARLQVQALDGGEAGLAPVMGRGTEAELVQRLGVLAANMPGRGRVALAYMPPEVREQARELADWLLQQPGFRESAERYEEIGKRFAEHATAKPEAHAEAARKAREDLRDRVAQVALRAAAGLNRERAALDKLSLPAEAQARAQVAAKQRFARGCWQSAWRGIERERLRGEAQLALVQERMLQQKRREHARGRRDEEDGRNYGY